MKKIDYNFDSRLGYFLSKKGVEAVIKEERERIYKSLSNVFLGSAEKEILCKKIFCIK
jgi:hypothetical protein